MQEKEMFLKKNRSFDLIIFFLFFLFAIHAPASNNNENLKTIAYLNDLKNFSVSFIQNADNEISEGKISIGKKRVRVEYSSPSKILIILDSNKAMYYNVDLKEDEFFDPKDTPAWFFFEIFMNPNFFSDSKNISYENSITLVKSGSHEIGEYEIKLIFENSPMILRKINLILDGTNMSMSIFNHKHEENYDENYFKLINPTFFDQ